MQEIGKITCTDGNKEYAFTLYPKTATFQDISALYMFTKETNATTHEILYIGESEILGSRISKHEKWACVNPRGCTHIAVHPISEVEREKTEKRLIAYYDPPCNYEW